MSSEPLLVCWYLLLDSVDGQPYKGTSTFVQRRRIIMGHIQSNEYELLVFWSDIF